MKILDRMIERLAKWLKLEKTPMVWEFAQGDVVRVRTRFTRGKSFLKKWSELCLVTGVYRAEGVEFYWLSSLDCDTMGFPGWQLDKRFKNNKTQREARRHWDDQDKTSAAINTAVNQPKEALCPEEQSKI